MTTTQILDDIRYILTHDYPTVKSFEDDGGLRSSLTVDFGANTFFRATYVPNEKKFTEMEELTVDIFHNIPRNGQARWFIDNTVLTTYKLFIEGAFPLLYAERFAEVCEIEAGEEEERTTTLDEQAQENGFSSLESSYKY